MHDTLVTLQGNLGGDVRLHETAESQVANFRVGSTPRWIDRKTGQWVDGTTVWYAVTAWRGLARNCADSLRRGDPVVVHGRLTTRSYVNGSGVEVSELEVTATFVGHDLTRGQSAFTKAPPRQRPAAQQTATRSESEEEAAAGAAA
jgi:single-strand DNA-binding protein